MLRILGWASIGLACFFAVRMHLLDRRMQGFRAPGVAPSAFAFVPIRWRQDLYSPEGRVLVTSAWRAFGAMVLWFIAGALFTILGS